MLESELLNPFEIAAIYRNKAGIPPIIIDSVRVPSELHPLIVDAEVLGVGDDAVRDLIVSALPIAYLVGVIRKMDGRAERLAAWLMEVEAAAPPYPDEWAAFLNMSISLDLFISLHPELYTNVEDAQMT